MSSSARLLAQVHVRADSTYEVLERLVASGLVVKVYEKSYHIDRKAAQYYLSKPGVTKVRELLGVEESVAHALYKNDTYRISTYHTHISRLQRIPQLDE